MTGYTEGMDVEAGVTTEFTLELDIMDTVGVTAWAMVEPPHYKPPSVTEDYATPSLGLEMFAFESGTTTFTGEYVFTCNGNHHVTYYVKDGNGIVVSSRPQVFEVAGGIDPEDTTSISPGWNLMSIPVIPADSSVEVVLAEVMDDIVSVWKWENNN